jgi:adenylosuccinate synthase
LRAYIIVDLGFGDCGKGLLTDYLARKSGAGLVVRYNGGAQAGHNVLTPDGRQHTFSQFGAGSFAPGVRTFLSRHVVVHPSALLVEGGVLEQKGVRDAFARIRVSENALVITPFHQAANHIHELARGAGRHGSCGVGVGEAVEDGLACPEERVLMGDLLDPARLRRKLRAIRERKRAQLLELYRADLARGELAREWQLFEHEGVIDNWMGAVARIGALGLIAPDETLREWLQHTETVVFEGAQGVLLDAEAGFHPYTTWSRCTGANARELIAEMAPGAPVTQIGVMRCYAVRHGPGPLPTETEAFRGLIAEQNQTNPWQGAVRYGWWDAVLARYALAVNGGVDALALTHLDLLPQLQGWNYSPGYAGPFDCDPALFSAGLNDGVLERFRLAPGLSLDQRVRFTRALMRVAPQLKSCAPTQEQVIRQIESALGLPVGFISTGPDANHVNVLESFRP